MYRNVGRAGKSNRSVGKKRRWQNELVGSFGPAGPAVSLIAGKRSWASIEKTQEHRPKRHKRKHGTSRAAKFRWPVYVTLGPHPLIAGALDVITLNSREEADRCGFSWVGRTRA